MLSSQIRRNLVNAFTDKAYDEDSSITSPTRIYVESGRTIKRNDLTSSLVVLSWRGGVVG